MNAQDIVDPDPRPASLVDGDAVRVAGSSCTACGFVTASAVPRCPVCGSDVAPAAFGPEGIVFASTVMRIRIPPRNPPFGLAYVILDDGPRVLAHAEVDRPLAVGARVRLTPPPGDADPADLYVTEVS